MRGAAHLRNTPRRCEVVCEGESRAAVQGQVKAVSLPCSMRGTWSKMESGWEVRSGVRDLGMAVVETLFEMHWEVSEVV